MMETSSSKDFDMKVRIVQRVGRVEGAGRGEKGRKREREIASGVVGGGANQSPSLPFSLSPLLPQSATIETVMIGRDDKAEEVTFKVADRRKFNADGSVREGVVLDEPKPPTQSAP